MRYCEDTIREDADRDIKNALRWIAAPSSEPVTMLDEASLRAHISENAPGAMMSP